MARLGTKEHLEQSFGKMSNDVFEIISETMQNEMQQLINYNVIPSKKNFIDILSTDTDFILKHLGSQFCSQAEIEPNIFTESCASVTSMEIKTLSMS